MDHNDQTDMVRDPCTSLSVGESAIRETRTRRPGSDVAVGLCQPGEPGGSTHSGCSTLSGGTTLTTSTPRAARPTGTAKESLTATSPDSRSTIFKRARPSSSRARVRRVPVSMLVENPRRQSIAGVRAMRYRFAPPVETTPAAGVPRYFFVAHHEWAKACCVAFDAAAAVTLKVLSAISTDC